MLLIYWYVKWPTTVRSCEERVIETSKKRDDECDSTLNKTDDIELMVDITITQKHTDIIKNTKEKCYLVSKDTYSNKQFKDFEQLFEAVVLTVLTVCFKIILLQFHQEVSCIGKVDTIVTLFFFFLI